MNTWKSKTPPSVIRSSGLCPAKAKMLSLRLFRTGGPQGREEKAFLSIKWILHLIDGAVQQPLSSYTFCAVTQ